MDMATIEYQGFMHTHQPKVRAKEKREVRGRVDNNHISLKNRQFARIRLGKKVTVQCLFLFKVNCTVLYNSLSCIFRPHIFLYQFLQKLESVDYHYLFGHGIYSRLKKNKQV